MVRPRIGPTSTSRWLRVPTIAICLLALLVLVIRLAVPAKTDLGDGPPIQSRLVLWTCEANPRHQFRNHFRFESLTCPTCGGNCEIQLDYICPEHKGPFSVLVRFARVDKVPKKSGSADSAIVSEYRYLDATDWHKSDGTVLCPRDDCNLSARRAKSPWASAKSPEPTSE